MNDFTLTHTHTKKKKKKKKEESMKDRELFRQLTRHSSHTDVIAPNQGRKQKERPNRPSSRKSSSPGVEINRQTKQKIRNCKKHFTERKPKLLQAPKKKSTLHLVRMIWSTSGLCVALQPRKLYTLQPAFASIWNREPWQWVHKKWFQWTIWTSRYFPRDEWTSLPLNKRESTCFKYRLFHSNFQESR